MSYGFNLEDLYKQVILDHYKSPRNVGELLDPALRSHGYNPLCGDEILVTVVVSGGSDDGTIDDIKFKGNGCSISQSAASMMTAAVKGKSIANARALSNAFKQMMSVHGENLDDNVEPADATSAIDIAAASATGAGSTGPAAKSPAKLGDLEALQGVVKFPVRIKCALLGWNTLLEALDGPKA